VLGVGYTNVVDTGASQVDRRISGCFKDLPGGQLLGPTFDYTHRLLDPGLAEGATPETPETRAPEQARMMRVSDFLGQEGLLEPAPDGSAKPVPDDIARTPMTYPLDRDARLQALARGDEGFLLSMAYSTQRGYARSHPFAGEIRIGEVELELDSRALRLYLPHDMPGQISTQSISYDSRSRRFTARVFAPDDRPGAVRAVITGYAFPMTRIPILARRLDRNDIIGKRDIEWKTVRAETVDGRTITDLESLVGQSPRRPITADRAIREDEVQPPTLVTRGKQVTIELTTPLMQLTALGKALQNGAKGDVVRVQNNNSGKIISAVVIGDKQVAVSTLNNIALQQD